MGSKSVFHFSVRKRQSSSLCGRRRSRQRYSRSFWATAKSVASSSSIALPRNQRRCTANSLPGSHSRLITSSCKTFAHGTRPRSAPSLASQNVESSNSSHSKHPSQQSPKERGWSSRISVSTTERALTSSGGMGRSEGNSESCRVSFFCSSKTSTVLRQAASWASLISPK